MERLSKRVTSMAASETLAMTALARELKEKGKDVISLSIGEPDFNTPETVKEYAKKAIDDNFTHYPPVPGYADLLKAVSNKFKRDNNLDYAPNQIVVSTGGKQSIYQVVMAPRRRGHHPHPLLGLLPRHRRDGRGQMRLCARQVGERLQDHARAARGCHHAEDQADDVQQSLQPDGYGV